MAEEMDCVNSKEEEPESDLLLLPSLVMCNLLSYLDLRSLKNLRLVNHLTKSMVEDEPRLLKNFNCHIADPTRLREVIDSNVPWNYFTIEKLDSNELTPFLENFGHVATHLFISSKGIHSYYISRHFRKIGPQLEHLSIMCAVNLEYCESLFNTPHTFVNVKTLDYSDYGFFSEEKGGNFKTILRFCPNLKTIHMSRRLVVCGDDEEDEEEMRESQDNALLMIYTPLIKYLKKRGILSQKGLTIDFSGGRRPQSKKDSDPYPLNYETLMTLVEPCEPIEGKLMNVPSLALPTLEDSRKLTKKQFKGLENVIGSIVVNSCRGMKDKLIPYSAEIIIDFYFENNFQDFKDFELKDGKVKVFRVESSDNSDFDKRTRLEELIFERFRPSLLEFSLDRANAFRHMKLRSFEWSPFTLTLTSNLVTFENGISSLGSIEAGFRDSIEKFECEVPFGCPHENIETFIGNFRSLKYFQIYDWNDLFTMTSVEI